MTEPIRDGELLPVVGGPCDGQSHFASEYDGKLQVITRKEDALYRLDRDARCWRWVEKEEER